MHVVHFKIECINSVIGDRLIGGDAIPESTLMEWFSEFNWIIANNTIVKELFIHIQGWLVDSGVKDDDDDGRKKGAKPKRGGKKGGSKKNAPKEDNQEDIMNQAIAWLSNAAVVPSCLEQSELIRARETISRLVSKWQIEHDMMRQRKMPLNGTTSSQLTTNNGCFDESWMTMLSLSH